MTAPPDDTTTNLHAVIAALRADRDSGLAREAALAEELAAQAAEMATRTAELADRKTEFDERIEHQGATADVLRVMSASPGDAQPVFDLIVRRAVELCNAQSGGLFQYDGERVHIGTIHGLYEHDGKLLHVQSLHGTEPDIAPASLAAYLRQFPMPPKRGSISMRAILDRQILHIRDMREVVDLLEDVQRLGHRSQVSLPLLRDARAIGVITIAAHEPGGFSESQIALLKTFAEQAVIAITSAETYRALQERTASLAARNSEYGERIDQQAATIEVLKAMSASAGDEQPVLDLVARRARELCDAETVGIFSFDRDMISVRCVDALDPQSLEAYLRTFPRAPTRDYSIGRAILDRRIIEIDDADADPNLAAVVHEHRNRSIITLPFVVDDRVAGGMSIAVRKPGGLTDPQKALARTLAEQVSIAIGAAETYRALQTRTSDLQETLEYQTATSDVLKVISRSTFDLQPVLTMVAETAARLCVADQAAIFRLKDDILHLAVNYGFPPEYKAYWDELGPVPFGKPMVTVLSRTIHERHSVHVHDVASVPGYPDQAIRLGKQRTSLGVRLLRAGEPIGVILLARQRVEPFTDRQIELVSTFADQAVIAIENSRLINEQQEALEQQTATAEVLQVINASPGNLTPVFDAILEKAHDLCGAVMGSLVLYDGTHLRAVATLGYPQQFAEVVRQAQLPSIRIKLLISDERFVHVLDMKKDSVELDHTVISRYGGAEIRTALWMPLRKDSNFLGFISAYRREVQAFSDNEIALLRNFAAQAVIAMENAGLLTEQQEALEQQTATAEILQVINASPGNLTPVFDAMLEKATRLCEAAFGVLWTHEGEVFRAAALRGVPPAYSEFVTSQPRGSSPGGVLGRLARGESLVHIPDAASPPPQDAIVRTLVELGNIRTLLAVPLRKDDALLGAFTIYREEVRPFSDKQIALLENFAAQAVIAMENARLINEQREALEQQTATAEVLQVINASPGNLAPVFDAILEKAHSLCGAVKGALVTFDGLHFRAVATRGLSEMYAQMLREPRTTRGSLLERLLNGASFVLEDTSTSPLPLPRAATELEGVRTVLLVPLRRDSTLLGYITTYSQEARAFTEKHIALLQNFAAQAVVAMENARLITEQHEALEQQTATAEVLQVINTSPGDLAPVFDAMLDKAIRLCDATYGHFRTYDGEGFPLAAVSGDPSLVELHRQRYRYFVPGPHNPISRFRRGEDLIHISDAGASEAYRDDPGWRELVDTGCHSVLAVALRKDTVLLGDISVYRQEVRAFSDKQIALLENFAAQAVIAMENARLLHEIRQRQAELRTTFDNIGDGVAMFDADLRLAAWNRHFQQIIDLPDALLRERPRYADYMRLLAERGEFGATGIEAELRQRIEDTDKELRLERVRPDGRVIEVRRNAVSGGGFVLIYSDITERKRSEEEIRAARDAAETALRELRTAQANLIQAEKMASLGQLTAGIAHEIKNPLNFVNNFAALSVDLLGELKETAAPGFAVLSEKQREEIEDVSAMLTSNLEKITEHGKRADGIVKAMLEHSRGSSGERRTVDLNALIDEALNLAYHGARAQDQSFNVTLERRFGEGITPIEVNPQDITRVFLNIFANGFYAVTRRARDGGDIRFVPTLKVTTRDAGQAVEIRVRDNGTGIPADIRDKLFQPFFTTKPTGEGTGLGLSITYDIVTQQHGGSIAVDSKVGDYSEFMIRLPRGVLAS